MSDYMLEFQAHIDESRRLEGFPKIVYIRELFQNVESDEHLKNVYNNRFKTLVGNPGIVVYMEDEIIDASSLRFDQRIYIPWHMIAYFHGKATLITPAPENFNPNPFSTSSLPSISTTFGWSV